MKNKILLFSTISVLAIPSFAEEERTFYLKANVGANKMNTVKETVEAINIKSIKQKSDITPFFGGGVGYYINNNIRTDITFDYFSPSFKDATGNLSYYDEYSYTGVAAIERKASIYSWMFNSYIDLPITENIKVFIGGGIGLAQLKEKLRSSFKFTSVEGNNTNAQYELSESSSTKRTNNFAYSLTTGTVFPVATNVNFELAYSWKDFGKAKPRKDADGDTPTKNHYKGHNILVGIRFEI